VRRTANDSIVMFAPNTISGRLPVESDFGALCAPYNYTFSDFHEYVPLLNPLLLEEF
jgi:hypothetical protein